MGLKLGVLGCHVPNFVQFSIIPPKGTSLRQNTRFENRYMEIGLGSGCARTWENGKTGHQRYISRSRAGGTLVGSMMKFGKVVEPLILMNHTNFHLNLMASLRASGWWVKKEVYLWNAFGSYNIALRYRAGKWIRILTLPKSNVYAEIVRWLILFGFIWISK
jgi:hypothetical protein